MDPTVAAIARETRRVIHRVVQYGLPTTVPKYTQPIVETRAEAFVVRCGHCHGTGGANGGCPVCNMEGTVVLDVASRTDDDADVSLVKCGTCRGTGTHGGICSVCNGVGAFVGVFPRERCPVCNGTGHNAGRCNRCHGIGSLSTRT